LRFGHSVLLVTAARLGHKIGDAGALPVVGLCRGPPLFPVHVGAIDFLEKRSALCEHHC
jgi:hypothetical protein